MRKYVFTRASEDGGKYVVRSKRYSLLLWGRYDWRALYDMEVDPEQRNNIIAQEPERAAELLEAFRTYAESQRRPPLHFLRADAEVAPSYEPEAPEKWVVSPEVMKDLKALGYVK